MMWTRKSMVIPLAFLLTYLYRTGASDGDCGFPGTPAFGYVKPNASLYFEGDIVSYSCRVGYILIGSSIRRCKNDGSWTEDVPICDDSMTSLGYATSTPAVPGHPAELAIDRNKNTCTHLLPREHRWWRIDLGNNHTILSVAVTMASTDTFTSFTVFVIKAQDMYAQYKRCASFTGKFGTPTIVLNCAEGKGLEGQRVHIEDEVKKSGFFELCEVEVQVKKDSGYTCGQPNRNPNSITFDIEGDEVEYGCRRGYELIGHHSRTCKTNGQWSGVAPICEAIVCEPLPALEKGQLRLSVMDNDVPLEGTVVSYNCDKGYRLIGDFNRECLRDGTWNGRHPKCEAVRCAVPDGTNVNGHYHLVNGSTRTGSIAYLRCAKKKRVGENPFISCTEEGNWTTSLSRCIFPWKISAVSESSERPRIAKKEAIIFGMVVAGMMMTVVLVSLFIVSQRRKRARKPQLPCRQTIIPEAPPRPPPRSKGALASTLLQCVTGDSDRNSNYGADEKENEQLLKTRSLPSKNQGKTDSTPNRASSLDKPFHEAADDNRDITRSTSPKSITESEAELEDEAVEEESIPEAKEADRTSPIATEVDESKPGNTSRDYAAIDYEKKRQSRLVKNQSSEDADESRQNTPTTPEEEDPTPPQIPRKGLGDKQSGNTSLEKIEESPKNTEPITDRRRRLRESADSGEDDSGKNPRRTRTRAAEPEEPEEKPTTRAGRRTRLRE